MTRASSPSRRLVLGVLIVAAALFGAAAATAAKSDSGVLNQTQMADVAGDSGSGPDISSLTVTTYVDGTVSFAVGFANRMFLESGETVQIFVDLNDDGKADLNLSVWPSFDPSYLDRAAGSGWTDIRQLPELVQTSGSVSVRLSLSELQSDGAVPVGPTIQVAAGTWSGGSAGTTGAVASDWAPSATTWLDHSIKPTTSGATTTTTGTTTPTKVATTTTSAKPVTTAAPPVTIERLAPLTVKSGADAVLHILLKSHAGPTRLFKVCTQLPASSGVLHLTQCRSTTASGGSGAVVFTISYKVAHAGTDVVQIHANAGTARASTSAVIHVDKT